VRMRAISGKNLPPVDAGEGVGVCSRLFIAVCCLCVGCTSGALVRVGCRPLVRDTNGQPPTGHRLCNLLHKCGRLLRLLLLLVRAGGSWGRKGVVCVLPVWGRCRVVFRLLLRTRHSSCFWIVIRSRGMVY